jgi:hypothetical protein
MRDLDRCGNGGLFPVMGAFLTAAHASIARWRQVAPGAGFGYIASRIFLSGI